MLRHPSRIAIFSLLTAAALSTSALAADQFDIATKNTHLLLAVENNHLTQLVFGSIKSKPAPAPTNTRRPPTPEDFYPAAGAGYIWEPALKVTHADGNTSTDLVYEKSATSHPDDDTTETRISLKDPQYPLHVTLVFRAYKNEDIIQQWTEIQHEESAPITLERFASASPVFPKATDTYLTQFYGKYKHEMTPSEEKLTPGIKILDSKLGSRAQYYLNPSFFLAPKGPATETTGEVFGGSLAWSGSFQLAFEIQTESNRLRALCGMNPYDSAYHLAPNTLFKTPAMLWSFSDHGKGQISRNFHRWARTYGVRDGNSPRPVLLNNWEATHMDFDQDKLVSLFDGAKAVGAECFLLDDGWFGNGEHARDNDRAGLGDWQPNTKKLPHGVEALADEAVKRGLRFGIWIEPEMTNPKSDLYQQHPDWVIQQPKRDPMSDIDHNRHQLVLDLTRPDVHQFVWHMIDNLLTSAPSVSYIKWDCNRYITQPGSTFLKPEDQQNLWIDYVNALYDVMHKTAQEHPKVQMMACAGGGGRVDYGTLPSFDTFWPSDNTDPLSRIKIQYGFSQFFPAVATADHVTRMGKRPMKFTFDVAMSGTLGMDMDLSKLSPDELAFSKSAIADYKTFRDVIVTGDLYRLESPYSGDGDASSPRTSLMYVLPDASRAIFFAYQTEDAKPAPIALQGLDPARHYTLHERDLTPGTKSSFDMEGKTLDGATLMKTGITPPVQKKYDSAVIELTAENATK
ncbi:MAG: alpha-galactosidase [Phycisphaerae bacterium]